MRGIHPGPVNSPHKWPVTWKMFPFDGVIMDDSARQWDVVYRVSVVETVLLRTKTACQSLLNNHFYHSTPRVVMMPTLSSTMAMYDCTPVKLSTMIWDHFSWNSKETMFSRRRLNVKITCHFQCSVDIINMIKRKKNLGKMCFGSWFYFGPTWPLHNQSPRSSSQEEALGRWTTDNIHC